MRWSRAFAWLLRALVAALVVQLLVEFAKSTDGDNLAWDAADVIANTFGRWTVYLSVAAFGLYSVGAKYALSLALTWWGFDTRRPSHSPRLSP